MARHTTTTRRVAGDRRALEEGTTDTMRRRELRAAVNVLSRINDRNQYHPFGEHPVDECRVCARWVAAVIDVWDAADVYYGPRVIAEGVRDIANREAKRELEATKDWASNWPRGASGYRQEPRTQDPSAGDA